MKQVDFGKKEGFISGNGVVTEINGVTVAQNVAKQTVNLQGYVIVDDNSYSVGALAIPDHPRILGELIRELELIKQAMETTHVH